MSFIKCLFLELGRQISTSRLSSWKALVRGSLVLVMLSFVSHCSEPTKQQSAKAVNAICSGNTERELCVQASGCEWRSGSCKDEDTSSQFTNNNTTTTTASCSSLALSVCTTSGISCVPIGGTCQDPSSTSLTTGSGQCFNFAGNQATCDANLACFYTPTTGTCNETNGRCQATDMTTCTALQSQGCTYNGTRCLPNSITSAFGSFSGGIIPGLNTTCEAIQDINVCNQYRTYCQTFSGRCSSINSGMAQNPYMYQQYTNGNSQQIIIQQKQPSLFPTMVMPTLLGTVMGCAVGSISGNCSGGASFGGLLGMTTGASMMGGFGSPAYANPTYVQQQPMYQQPYYPQQQVGYPMSSGRINCSQISPQNCFQFQQQGCTLSSMNTCTNY